LFGESIFYAVKAIVDFLLVPVGKFKQVLSEIVLFFLDSVLKLFLKLPAVSMKQAFHFLGLDKLINVDIPLLQSLELCSDRLEVFVLFPEGLKAKGKIKLVHISTVFEVFALVFNPGKVLGKPILNRLTHLSVLE